MPSLDSLLAPLAPDTASVLQQIDEKIRQARRVQVLGHLRPDGDCIGSLLGIHGILAQLGIEHALTAENHLYPSYALIPGYQLIDTAPRPGYGADLTIFVDCADRSRAFPDWKAEGTLLSIDHHGSNTRYANLNWIEPKCASTTEMIYYLIRSSALLLDPDTATALLLGLMTDTGSYRYSSVRPEHFEISADFLRSGADLPLIAKAAYESRGRVSAQLGCTIMANLKFAHSDTVAWGEARLDLLERFGGAKNIPENLVSEIRSLDGVRVSILFIEDAKGGLRASLRGDGLINVSQLAQEFGGGGHPNAAGITIPVGSYLKLRDAVLARVEQQVNAALLAQ